MLWNAKTSVRIYIAVFFMICLFYLFINYARLPFVSPKNVFFFVVRKGKRGVASLVGFLIKACGEQLNSRASPDIDKNPFCSK